MPDNLDKGAREMADLLKEGKTEDFKKRLSDDAQHMTREDFNGFMDKLKSENQKDLAANKDLPEVKVEKRSMAGTEAVTQVDVTTPGKVMGNWWRDNETVLKSDGNGMLAVAERSMVGRQAQLEEAMSMADGSYDQKQANKPIEQKKTDG